MSLEYMFDAAYPSEKPYPGCAAVAGYIGGNTPHVWSLAEWQRFAHLRQLPIWVAYGMSLPAVEQAKRAAAAAVALGWAAHHAVERVIALDEETATDRAFVAAFAAELHVEGFGCWPYGSQSSIFGDPSEDGVWMALYDGKAGLENFPHVVAHQYAANVAWMGGAVDLSVVSAEAVQHLGHGPRRAA